MSFGLSNRAVVWIFVALSLATASIVAAVSSPNATARVFDAPASGDTYLSTGAPSIPHGSATTLWVSKDSGGQNLTLIQFDLAGRLQPGDLVLKARMRLAVSDARAATWPLLVITGRILTSWQENATTYGTVPLVAFDTITTTAIGVSGPPARGTAAWIDVTKQLSRWHSYGGPSNFGTVLMMGPEVTSGAVAFASRDNVQIDRPMLEVTFAPGPRTIYGYTLGASPLDVGVARTE